MCDWDGTSDQYKADTYSVYPLYSDIETSDYDLGYKNSKNNKLIPYVKERMQNAANTGKKLIHDNLYAPMRTGCGCGVAKDLSKEGFKGCADPIGIDINTMILIFIFIFTICCYFSMAINDLKSEIKVLKMLLKNR